MPATEGSAGGVVPVPDASIRDAATLILLRTDGPSPSVLMGQRGSGAAFMPSKFVFPGGGVDQDDADVPLHAGLDPVTEHRLGVDGASVPAAALGAAAVRELWEETGLRIAGRGRWRGGVPGHWRSFADGDYLPDLSPLRFVFRAVTPPGRTRRFDARFFLASAEAVASDADDFAGASGELSHLQWVPLDRTRDLSLPFITEIVLAEVSEIARNGFHPGAGTRPQSVPFFDNRGPVSAFRRIGGG